MTVVQRGPVIKCGIRNIWLRYYYIFFSFLMFPLTFDIFAVCNF